MKIIIQYATNKHQNIEQGRPSYVYKTVEIEPISIARDSYTRKGVVQRYQYIAFCKPPEDAGQANYITDGVLRCPINRKLNKSFKPKTLNFINGFHHFTEVS